MKIKKEEIIYLASKYANKGYDFDKMYYCDDFCDNEDQAKEVWEYIIEYKNIGKMAFYEKYQNYKLY